MNYIKYYVAITTIALLAFFLIVIMLVPHPVKAANYNEPEVWTSTETSKIFHRAEVIATNGNMIIMEGSEYFFLFKYRFGYYPLVGDIIAFEIMPNIDTGWSKVMKAAYLMDSTYTGTTLEGGKTLHVCSLMGYGGAVGLDDLDDVLSGWLLFHSISDPYIYLNDTDTRYIP